VSFVTALALGIGLLVGLPFLAHRLRRKRADEHVFAAAHLVPAAPPRARSRARLEDRGLFLLRVLAVLGLAFLGASPLVRCSRLSVQRSSGASLALAIVLDDSMSMRAPFEGGKSRFARAKDAADELVAGGREGDSIAIVLAGSPPRVALAATTDLSAARATLEGIGESDRGTDLDGAISMAEALVTELPQVDKRIVLLSDRADGKVDEAALGERSSLPLWVAIPELGKDAADCAIIAADDLGGRVRAQVRCGPGANAAGREVVVSAGDKELGRAAAPTGASGDVFVTLPKDAPTGDVVAKLSGTDAIAADDLAPVLVSSGPGSLAIVIDATDETAVTGGAPVLEQALSALRLDLAVRPQPAVPERKEDLAAFLGVIVDDAPGLTPEQRRALSGYLDEGGVVLLALGSRAGAAPLGASFEPVLSSSVGWFENPSPGADASKNALGEGTRSLEELEAKHRATLAPSDATRFDVLVPWKDGAPLVARRTVGRGEAWIVTLPFAVEGSDLVLRPGFLALLDAFVERARAHAAPRRSDAGQAWIFDHTVTAQGPSGPLEARRDTGRVLLTPPRIGAYRLQDGDRKETRVAAPVAAELDLRPRNAAAKASGEALGDTHAQVDISSKVALALLVLMLAELVLRLRARKVDAPAVV